MNSDPFISLLGSDVGIVETGLVFSVDEAGDGLPGSSGLMPRPVFIGVGGAGANMVYSLAYELREQLWHGKSHTLIALDRPDERRKLAPLPSEIQIAAMLACAMEPRNSGEISCVVLLAGLGGSTGGVVARVAAEYRELGVPVTAAIALPFSFEGQKRRSLAEEQLEALQANCSEVVVMDNNDLLSLSGSMPDAFRSFNQKAADVAITAAWQGNALLSLDMESGTSAVQ